MKTGVGFSKTTSQQYITEENREKKSRLVLTNTRLRPVKENYSRWYKFGSKVKMRSLHFQGLYRTNQMTEYRSLT